MLTNTSLTILCFYLLPTFFRLFFIVFSNLTSFSFPQTSAIITKIVILLTIMIRCFVDPSLVDSIKQSRLTYGETI